MEPQAAECILVIVPQVYMSVYLSVVLASWLITVVTVILIGLVPSRSGGNYRELDREWLIWKSGGKAELMNALK